MSLSRLPVLVLACLWFAFPGQTQARAAAEPQTGADIPTLERVQAVLPEEEMLDLYRLQNPVAVEPNGFEKAYDPGITPEEMALERGGYINYGINLGLYKSWQGLKKVTGMRAETEHAIARPPPLTEAQGRRAATLCNQEENACPSGLRLPGSEGGSPEPQVSD